jgi:hypothetical protein
MLSSYVSHLPLMVQMYTSAETIQKHTPVKLYFNLSRTAHFTHNIQVFEKFVIRNKHCDHVNLMQRFLCFPMIDIQIYNQ